jgi:hypothetical protein
MISIIWDVYGIHGLLTLPKGAKHNPDYFTKTVVPDLQTNVYNSEHRKTLK